MSPPEKGNAEENCTEQNAPNAYNAEEDWKINQSNLNSQSSKKE